MPITRASFTASPSPGCRTRCVSPTFSHRPGWSCGMTTSRTRSSGRSSAPVPSRTAASTSATRPEKSTTPLPPSPSARRSSTRRTWAPFTPASAARIAAATVVVSTMPSASVAAGARAPPIVLHHLGVDVGQEHEVQDGVPPDLAAGGERLLHVGDLAADQHQVLPVVDRARLQHVDRGALGHRVGRLHARRRCSRARRERAPARPVEARAFGVRGPMAVRRSGTRP